MQHSLCTSTASSGSTLRARANVLALQELTTIKVKAWEALIGHPNPPIVFSNGTAERHRRV